jgi:hypothetical protein
MTKVSARRDTSKRSATPAADATDGSCQLCGFTPSGDDTGGLRRLGEPPVVVTVCADRDACVTRYMHAFSASR